MRRAVRTLAAALAAVLALLAVPGIAQANTTPARDRLVVMVLAPYMTWDDVTSGHMPATQALARAGAIGDINDRASSQIADTSDQTLSALAISSSAASALDPAAAAAYDVGEHYEMGTAADAYRRVTGGVSGNDAIVYLGLPRIVRANAEQKSEARVGSLGQAIVDAGGHTAALGNSDWGYEVKQTWQSRPAALVAMDESGKVAFGDVSTDVLASDEDAPYGASSNMGRLRARYARTLRQLAAAGGPGLVVIDPGDPERATQFAADVSDSVAAAQHARAMERTDALVKMVRAGLPTDAVVMVVSQIQQQPKSGPAGFAPVIIGGSGWRGLVVSSSTHRPGLATVLDVAPTVLSEMGIARPVEMFGNAISSDGSGASFASRLALLRSLSATAVAVDTVRGFVTNTYIATIIVILLAGTVLLLVMKRRPLPWAPRAAAILRGALLLALSVPVSSMLMFLADPRPRTPGMVVALLLATLAIVWLAVLFAERRFGCDVALIGVALLTGSVIMADQLLGAPLSYSGIFSYSPLLGARYYGMGNEGASVLVGALLVGLALLFDRNRDTAWLPAARRWAPPLVGLAVVVVAAAPFLGANVGVVAWGLVAFAVLWFQMNGYRLSWKTVLLVLLGIVLIVAAFSAYDLLVNKSGGQTHLARAWESAESGGAIQLWDIVARKASTNARVLQASNWSYLLIVILCFLGYMRWKPHGDFAAALKRYPHFAIAITAALAGSLVGYFTEDSGIVIPALIMLYLAGGLLCLMLVNAVEEAKERL